MKLTWFRRVILSDGPWQSVVNNTISVSKLFVSGRCYANDVQNKIKKWFDVLRAYSDDLQLNGKNTEYHILSSPIFYNNNTTIGSKPTFIKENLVHDNGKFLSPDEFEHTYNITTNFVQFQVLKWAIVVYARTHSKVIFSTKKKLLMPSLPSNIHILIKSKKGGKDFYTILNQNLDMLCPF